MNKRIENLIADIIVGIILIGLAVLAVAIIYLLIAAAGYFVEYIMIHIVDPVMVRNQTLGYILFFIAPIGIGSYLILKNV